MRLPPHHVEANPPGRAASGNMPIPSTAIRSCGFTPRMALPAVCAASCQSVLLSPVPHVAPCEYWRPAGVCGSLRRSMPTTVGLPAYRLAMATQSFTHALCGNWLVYQSPFCSALLPASERWSSRITRRPAAPAAAMILSMICRDVRPFRSVLMGLPLLNDRLDGTGLDSTIWFENGIRMVL